MKVTITEEALVQIAELPRTMRLRVLSVTERLAGWPDVSGVKWLTADWRGFARIRTGDWRVIFRIEDDEVVVERIAHRREAYAD